MNKKKCYYVKCDVIINIDIVLCIIFHLKTKKTPKKQKNKTKKQRFVFSKEGVIFCVSVFVRVCVCRYA